jgi:toxin-antitoxin system PIN domain toxin
VLALDTNLLVYAHRREPTEHSIALHELRKLAEGSDPWAIPWPCIYEFFSVVTNPRIWRDAASTPRQAAAQLRAWCASPSLVLIGESEGFLDVLGPLLERPRVRGPVVHDARVAAICLAHGVEALLTRDRDFSLFPELETRDPFA